MKSTMNTTDAQLAIDCQDLSLSRSQGADFWGQAASWRNQIPVLQSLSLQVPLGAVMGLIGRNGAGKSSLMRCLLGFTPPEHGSSSLLGSPSLHLSDAVRERLGYVAQTPDLFGSLSGQAHLSEMSKVYQRFDIEYALRLALRLDLPLGVRADKLSLGDQQKLSVLLGLAHHPDLLLLDEPVASLDPMARRDFMRALFADAGERAEPRTVLISSHLLSDLERVVSHVCFLREGRVQLVDEWDALLEHLRLIVSDRQIQDPGLLSQRASEGRFHALMDLRLCPQAEVYSHGRQLRMEDLFEELNACS